MSKLTKKQLSARARRAYQTRRLNEKADQKMAGGVCDAANAVKVGEAIGQERTQVGETIHVLKGRPSLHSDCSGQLKILTPPKKEYWPTQREAMLYYGNPTEGPTKWAHDNLVHVPCPWALYIGDTHTPFITIHRKCAVSLNEVLKYIWEGVGEDQGEIHRLGYDFFLGSWDVRKTKGSSALSMHAYGAAIDFSTPFNPQYRTSTLFGVYSVLVDAFKAAGWEWENELSTEFPMHVQAARSHG